MALAEREGPAVQTLEQLSREKETRTDQVDNRGVAQRLQAVLGLG